MAAELARTEKARVEREYLNLELTKVVLGSNIINVRHVLALTMLDGKAAQAITNTSTGSTCFICGALPSQMNDLSKLQLKSSNEEALKSEYHPCTPE